MRSVFMKIKKSKEEIEGYLKTTEDMLRNEQQVKERIISSGSFYPEELHLVEENIKNYKKMIDLLKQNL